MWVPEVESRTQDSRPRQRTQKKSEAKAKDRHSRGQGQECSRSRSRTQTQVFSPPKNLKNFFSGNVQKKSRKNFFSRSTKFYPFKNNAVLKPRTGQFSRTWGFVAKAKNFKMCPRGQGRPQGLHLWWVGTLSILTLSVFEVSSILGFVQFGIFSIRVLSNSGFFFVLDFLQFGILSDSEFCFSGFCFSVFLQDPFGIIQQVQWRIWHELMQTHHKMSS